jgi:hypothetical protein
MEVHHHPHPAKKRFKEYLFEGIMIFLAVSLGFIAENIREKIVENERAEVLAESLYQEAYADSVQLQKVIANRIIKEKELGRFIDFIRDSSLSGVNAGFYRSFTWSFMIVSPIAFDPSDGMLVQLRNSGSLRYFKSSLLQREFGELSVIINKVRNRAETENSFGQQFIRPIVIKHYNFEWYDQLTRAGAISVVDAVLKEPDPLKTPVISNLATLDKTEIINTASYYQLILRGTRQIQLTNYADVNHRLLQTLRKEYHVGEK